MDIEKHSKEFQKIIQKYNLSDEKKAEAIANFLTKSSQKQVSAKEFSELFAMTQKEAVLFLSFVEKGIKFKQNKVNAPGISEVRSSCFYARNDGLSSQPWHE